VETSDHHVATDAALDADTLWMLNSIADKWTLTVTRLLLNGPLRFSALRRAVGGISHKMLAQTLRDLERNGLVERTVYPHTPPQVEYSLTLVGSTLCEPLQAFARWTAAHRAEIEAARAAFDRRAERERAARPAWGVHGASGD
jgi:DNA-binding HxlR family transcriptional regulator